MSRVNRLGCVCVCVFVTLLATVPPIKARRVLHFCSVFRGLHLFSVFFCPTRTNCGHTGGGKHRGFFLLFIFLFCPTFLLRCLPSFLSREGFSRPVPSSTATSNFVYSRSFSAFYRFLLPGTKVRKNPLSPRFEPVTWVLEGYEDTN